MAKKDEPPEGAWIQDGDDVNREDFEYLEGGEDMDIDTSPTTFIEPTLPLYFGCLAAAKTSGPPPTVPLPPNPATWNSQDHRHEIQGIPLFKSFQSSNPMTENSNIATSSPKPGTANQPTGNQWQELNMPGGSNAQKKLGDESDEDIEMQYTETLKTEGDKRNAIPSYLKAAFRKYPRTCTFKPGGGFQDENVVMEEIFIEPLRIEKVAKVAKSQTENAITEQVILDLDTLLGFPAQNSLVTEYIRPQDPLIVRMASVPNRSPDIPPSSTDDDDEEHGQISRSEASGMGGESSATPAKKKKKRVRKRKGKGAGSGAPAPGQQSVGTAALPPLRRVTTGMSSTGGSASASDAAEEEDTTPNVVTFQGEQGDGGEKEPTTPTGPETSGEEQEPRTDKPSTHSEPPTMYEVEDQDALLTPLPPSEPATPEALVEAHAEAEDSPSTPTAQNEAPRIPSADTSDSQDTRDSGPTADASSTPLPYSEPTPPRDTATAGEETSTEDNSSTPVVETELPAYSDTGTSNIRGSRDAEFPPPEEYLLPSARTTSHSTSSSMTVVPSHPAMIPCSPAAPYTPTHSIQPPSPSPPQAPPRALFQPHPHPHPHSQPRPESPTPIPAPNPSASIPTLPSTPPSQANVDPRLNSPFIPAPTPEKQIPPLPLGKRAPTMISHPGGVGVPRREFDHERLVRERAEVERLVRGRGEGGEGLGVEGDVELGIEPGDGIQRQGSWDVGDDTGSGLGVRSSIKGLEPTDNPLPAEVLNFRQHLDSLPTNSIPESTIQLAQSAISAALSHAQEPSQKSIQENLRLRAVIESLNQTSNNSLKELSMTNEKLQAKELEMMGIQKKHEEETRWLRQLLDNERQGLNEELEREKREPSNELESEKQKLSEESEGESKRLSEDLQNEKQKVENLESLVEELKKDLAERREHQAVSDSQPVASNDSAKEAEFNALLLELSEKKKVVQDLKAEYDDSNVITRADCQRLSEEKDRVHEQRVEDLQADIKILESKLEKAETSGREGDEAGKKSEERTRELEQQVTELRNSLDVVRNEEASKGLITEEEATAQRDAAVGRLEEEIMRLQGKLKDAAEKASSQSTADETRMKELQEEVEALNEENNNLIAEAESMTRDSVDEYLQEIERLKDELESAKLSLDSRQGATSLDSKDAAQLTDEKSKLEARVAELEQAAKTPTAENSTLIEEWETRKANLTEKLETEKTELQEQIADLRVKLQPFEDGDTISRTEHEAELSRERKILCDQIEVLQKQIQDGQYHALIEELEKSQRSLKETNKTLRYELQQHRDTGKANAPSPTASLSQRITDLGQRATESTKKFDSQTAELSKRGILSDSQQMRLLESQNAKLTRDVARLKDKLRTARNRKVASADTRIDEKDAKIDDLGKNSTIPSQDVGYSVREALRSNGQHARLLDRKMKLEKRLEEVEKRLKERKKKKCRADREVKDKSKKKLKSERKRGKKTANKAVMTTQITEKEAEIRKYENLDPERELLDPRDQNRPERITTELFTRHVIQWMICRVEQYLASTVASRAINGLTPNDALHAVQAGDVAIRKAEELGDEDLRAQALMWAGIANFYNDQNDCARDLLHAADGLRKHLKVGADLKILDIWIRYGVENKSAERGMEGYRKRFKIGSERRLSTASTTSIESQRRHDLQRVKPSQKMNDLPEFDSDGIIKGGEESDGSEGIEE